MSTDVFAFPMSFAQQRLWFLDQLSPGNAFYNLCVPIPLSGPISERTLERSINDIVRRHEILRTSFLLVDEQPTQIIEGHLTVPLRQDDLRKLPEDERRPKLLRQAAADAQRPFDLGATPLLRTALVQLTDLDYVFILTMHHIIADGWSLGVFWRELVEIYTAFSHGRASPLPGLPLQYADVAVWQRKWLQGEALEEQLGYWREQLDHMRVLELPTDHTRPAIVSYRGACHDFVLTPTLTKELQELSRQEDVTLFMTLLAAFNVLLHHYSGQDDIVIGSPIANRSRLELEKLIGFFVNTLVMRTDLTGDPTFQVLLQRVREVSLGAYSHQEVPFEKLVDELNADRDLSRNPIFQVTFQLFQTLAVNHANDGASNQPELQVTRGTSMFDLALNMWEMPDGIHAQFEFSTELFEPETIARMTGNYLVLLESIVANPRQRISGLAVLTPDERRKLLTEWNDTSDVFPDGKCIHTLFEDQEHRAPDALAVVYGKTGHTYRELNQRSNQLANYLRAAGVTTESLVAICMERSPDMLVAMLGVLKAGGAYVPMDPSYPRKRLAYMLRDSQARVLLAQRKTAREFADESCRVVCLDSDWNSIAVGSKANPKIAMSPNNLAYVIYTSGSTGLAKGVQVEHAGLYNLIAWHNQEYQVSASDRATQLAGAAFDASAWEVWPYFVAGACVHVIDDATRTSPSELIHYISTHDITLSFVPTPLAEQLLKEPWPRDMALRSLLTGGDKLHQVATRTAGFEIVNHYGPTENSVVATWAKLPSAPHGDSIPPIGRPIANNRAYVLDRHNQPVPIGATGELHIGGSSLARGYWRLPGLTAQRFMPDPFGAEPGGQLYKTGDLVRYRADGNLEFQGRLDQQVKIRGLRIELGDIEAALNRHPCVQESVVVDRGHGPTGKRLIAYVVLDRPCGGPAEELRAHLNDEVPEYMVPYTVTVLDSLPLTPNGKIDRRRLPLPTQDENARVETDHVAPRSHVEKALAKVWAETLGIERIGIHDNFFRLGADSILCIQIIGRAKGVGLKLTPRQIFQHQTIATLAEVSSKADTILTDQGIVTGTAPLTPIQLWFFEQNFADPHHFNQAYMLEVREELQAELLEAAVEKLRLQHDALRLRFEVDNDESRQCFADPGGPAPFIEIDVSDLPEDDQRQAIEAKAEHIQASLDLVEGPVMRVAMFNLGPGRPARLLIVIHHLAVDGISWRVIFEDLWAAYLQLQDGGETRLPDKTTSFRDWSARLLEYAQSDDLQKEFAYWLENASRPVGRLPTDFDNGQNSVASLRSVSVKLAENATRELLQEVPAAYQTQIDEVLLTALVSAFVRWTGESSLYLDLEGHGREALFSDLDVSRTVGWFTTVYPMRLELPVDGKRGDYLMAIKEQIRRVPARGIGFGLLRYLETRSDIGARLAALPVREVSFNYLGQFGHPLSNNAVVRPASESFGSVYSPRALHCWLLEINCSVSDGCLGAEFNYSSNIHKRSTIERLAGDFVAELEHLIAHCRSPEAGSYTPSDFPQAKISQRDFDKIIGKIGKPGTQEVE